MDAPSVSHPDQSLLDASILSLIDEQPSDEVEFLICLYLPLLRGDHADLLARLATYDNFFVREAVAEAIGSAGLSGSREILVKLTDDPHPQVQAAAARALKLQAWGSSHGA
nr:HEAT repeat domain-containing protein [Pseudoxanthomonas sp. PXM03]